MTLFFFKKKEDILQFKNNCPSLNHIIFTQTHFKNYPLFSDYQFFNDTPLKYENIDIDIAAIIYTSGSTGLPKGVTMTHLNIRSAVLSIITYLRNVPQDIILNVLQLSFDYGLYQVFMCFTFGGTMILLRDFIYIAKVLWTLEKESVTGFPIVPTILSLIFKMADFKKYDFSHLLYITNTDANFPVSYIKS